MEKNDLLVRIRYLIHEKKSVEEIRTSLENYHPNDLAKVFNQLSSQERQFLYEVVSKENLALIFEYLDNPEDYLKEISYHQGASILNEMETDDACDVLQNLDEPVEATKYLELMDKEDAEELRSLTTHKDGTAGSLMSTNFIKFQSGCDVKDAVCQLGYDADEAEVIDPLFVCNNEKLIGVVSLKDLIIARTPKKIDEIMDTNFIFADISESSVSAVDKITNYDLIALPVLENGNLAGIITMDDALDVAYQEIDEDIQKMAAIDENSNQSSIKTVFKRLPWLIVLLIISLLISRVTASFEEIIQKVTVLWFFNTMILDMAGNAATQSLAVAVRKLGRNELGKHRTLNYLFKELLVIIVNSIVLGIVCYGVSMGFIYLCGLHEQINVYITALVIALSMSLAIIITGILGSIIPLFIKKIKLDPAVASGPLITTINDVVAMVLYFELAKAFMPLIIK